MKSYIINVASSTLKLDHMTSLFNSAEINFERFDAIDAAKATRHPASLLLQPMKHRKRSPGELGCLLSHYEIWRKIADQHDEFSAVFEDDIFIDFRLKLLLEHPRIPKYADILKLETMFKPVLLAREHANGPEGIHYRQLLSKHHGTAAYIISKQGAAKLVKSIADFDEPVDDVIFGPSHRVGRQLIIYQALPALAAQSDRIPSNLHLAALRSDLDQERTFSATSARKDQLLLKLFRRLGRLLIWPYTVARDALATLKGTKQVVEFKPAKN